METKICSKCGEEYPATKEFFYQRENGLRTDCKVCVKSRADEYYYNHSRVVRIKVLQQTRICNVCGEEKPLTSEYFHKNREYLRLSCKECHNKKYHDYKYTWARKHNLKSNYGMSLDDYDSILKEQDGVCAICGKHETRKIKGVTQFLSVDHDHQTWEVRGLLCTRCNTGIGMLADSTGLICKAAEYLETWYKPGK